jgi:hypothetical protein
VSIAERTGDFQQPLQDGRMAMRASVPIEAGVRNLEVEVHVKYALR